MHGHYLKQRNNKTSAHFGQKTQSLLPAGPFCYFPRVHSQRMSVIYSVGVYGNGSQGGDRTQKPIPPRLCGYYIRYLRHYYACQSGVSLPRSFHPCPAAFATRLMLLSGVVESFQPISCSWSLNRTLHPETRRVGFPDVTTCDQSMPVWHEPSRLTRPLLLRYIHTHHRSPRDMSCC